VSESDKVYYILLLLIAVISDGNEWTIRQTAGTQYTGFLALRSAHVGSYRYHNFPCFYCITV